MRNIFRESWNTSTLVRDAVKSSGVAEGLSSSTRYQVYETRAAGADAILLIAECLETSELIDLQILATELNLTVLIEVHDLDNLMRVRDHVIGFPHRSYSLLGINNRDLRTFMTRSGHHAAHGRAGGGPIGAGQRKRDHTAAQTSTSSHPPESVPCSWGKA